MSDDFKETLDGVYGIGFSVVKGANPFKMTGRALGYSDSEQSKVNKRVKNYGIQGKKKKKTS